MTKIGDKVTSTDKTACACTTCTEGKISSSYKKACVNEINGYLSYKADATCITCDTGFFLVKDKDKCIYGCKTEGIDTNVGKYVACNDVYLLITDTSSLLGCKTEGTGTNVNKYVTCNDGYLLITAQTVFINIKLKEQDLMLINMQLVMIYIYY